MSPHERHKQAIDSENVNPTRAQDETYLKRYDNSEVHDLVCVGFGPASLAIAVALHDALEKAEPNLRTHQPKVRFLERQAEFSWHKGMLIPGSKLQVSFIKDLATLRNPRSKFTFLNYLHENGRLVPFTNLGTFLPQRLEYADYMRWCAEHFADVVDYNQNVEMIEAGQTNGTTGAVQNFLVLTSNGSGMSQYIRTKHVVIAIGGRPNIPPCIDINHPRVFHSSEYATGIPDILASGNQPRIAVIGGGQSAAEIFHDIPSRFPNAKSYLLIRDSALRPSDDSPFVNEIFDPDKVDGMYSQEPRARAAAIAENKSTNYGVVRLDLLESIYSALYSYRVKYASEADWPQRIVSRCHVTGMKSLSPNGPRAIRLYLDYVPGNSCKGATDEMDVDLVIVASGYKRDVHKGMLNSIRHLLINEDAGCRSNYKVGRNYGLCFQNGTVEREAGVWLQGCNESTHGLSDSLLSILSTRGGEMVDNIFGTGVASP